MNDALTWQMLRQRAAGRLDLPIFVLRGRWLCRWRCKLGRGLLFRNAFLQLGQLQLKLIEKLAATLRRRAMSGVLELGNCQLQRLDHLIPRNHHRLQGSDVGGQWGSGAFVAAAAAARTQARFGFARDPQRHGVLEQLRRKRMDAGGSESAESDDA
jgi:hypothetical protein